MTTEHGPGEHPAGDELDIELTENAVPDWDTRAVHIDFDGTVRQQIVEFAMTDTRREMGGVLIGSLSCDGKPAVQITAMIPARYTDAGNASITFTHETWQDILAIKDRAYPDLKIVGWFHTHPGFGIFLSRFDMHIHEHFFNLDWQVAYVVDPLAHTEGFFRWEAGKVQKTLDFEIVGELPAAPAPVPLPVRARFDWHYLAIAALLGVAVYLQFFRPPEIKYVKVPTKAEKIPIVQPPPLPPPPAVPAHPAEGWPVYVVQPNDSLWEISERCYGDGAYYPAIVLFNHLADTNIMPGMRLKIPGGTLPLEQVP
ncbi:MAG: LysM peptidoglycan-binding domain-containing protein [Armatimonadota bacterium]